MDFDMPLVSVVIPCYNQASFLKETIESVLKSTYSKIEIIIVNDGSTDHSLQVALKAASTNQQIDVIDQENSGVAAARNNGIQKAKGELILPLDGDDLIAEDYIEKSVEQFQKDPEVKVVYAQAVKFNEQGTKPWNLKKFSRNALARDNMIYVSGLFRKSDWEDCGGFSEDMKMGREDWEFWIKMLKNGGKVVQLPFVGFFYRLSPNSKRKRTGTNEMKKKRIAYLNSKHSDFFEKELNGPLRFQRTWSKPYNTLLKWVNNFFS